MLFIYSMRAFCPQLRFAIAVTVTIAAVFNGPSFAQGIAAIQNTTSRPFVTGITPVIGSNGAVGGVLVDTEGVVRRVEPSDLRDLRGRWKLSADLIAGKGHLESDVRVISLARLDRAIGDRLNKTQSILPEMIFLAGLQRVEYVLAIPEQNDVLLVGPGGPWKANDLGEVVCVKNGRAVLRLDDLMDSIRIAQRGKSPGIRCSIDPTPAGMQKYTKARARVRTFNMRAVRSLESAIGPQQVRIDGIDPESHFARVMFSADYTMKRLAMGFDESPVADMPSYLEMLKQNSTGGQLSSPRWWMSTDYEPLRCTPDRLGWQLRGRGVRTMAQDSKLAPDGTRQYLSESNPLAQAWADSMTDNYEQVSASLPVFGDLRNCFDLAVVGALIASEGLAVRADCELSVLTDDSRLQGPRLPTPKSVASQASLTKSKNGWIVSVSGGVEIDPWSVVERTTIDKDIEKVRSRVGSPPGERWWW